MGWFTHVGLWTTEAISPYIQRQIKLFLRLFREVTGRDRNNLDMPQEIMRVLCESIRIFAGEWTVFEVL